LTLSELQELWLGPCNGSVFNSAEELRAAWASGRAVVMRLWADTRRPMAWWCFEAPGLALKYPGYDAERSYLWRAGVLSEAERIKLEAEWRRDFDDAARKTSAKERREHLAFHDVPAELIEAWTPARRRRARQSAVSEETVAAK
jgi:hypothetical protein